MGPEHSTAGGRWQDLGSCILETPNYRLKGPAVSTGKERGLVLELPAKSRAERPHSRVPATGYTLDGSLERLPGTGMVRTLTRGCPATTSSEVEACVSQGCSLPTSSAGSGTGTTGRRPELAPILSPALGPPRWHSPHLADVRATTPVVITCLL